ncbi:inositol-tetrakisphosphate 1-kinase 1 [Tanacetum coccineum]
MSESEDNLFKIGYALSSKKVVSFMTPSFMNHAKHQGIDFIPINILRLTHHQPHFDCILHKLNTNEWNIFLHSYSLQNPKTLIIDPISNIKRLHNRLSMLDFINNLNIPNLTIPNQTLVSDTQMLSNLMDATELKFPMIAKPVAADGSTKSHKMLLVLNKDGLSMVDIDTPVVLQQFVNHGGVIFKVYVAGEFVKCVKRTSLPDISNQMLEKMSLESKGVMNFSQISNSALAVGDIGEGEGSGVVEMPGDDFVGEVAKAMRQALGLRLFNFDMIRDANGSGYLVIDINYFPGYEKLDSYETVMTDFLLNVMKSRAEGEDGASETQ